ncbi:MAG: TetR/AcrR family transcriptional regulator C-terminal domain-containing protein [Solobacterium sp.]|nr:TetR/AcrR family transcriptional regulator C-terminal domain-containing protein [Solobacterium sp.]
MAIDIKKVFADSMIRLLDDRPFEQITVKDLCAMCGASRQTFYNHFYDKYDLIVWICRKQCEDLWASFQRRQPFRECMLDVYELLYNNQAFYTVVMNIEGPNSFHGFLIDFTKEYYRSAITAAGKELDDELDYAISFCTVGTIEMALSWIRHGFRQTPQQMVEYQVLCCPDPLKPYLE